MPRHAPRRRRPLIDRRVGRLEARLAVETDARRALEGRVEHVERRLDLVRSDMADVADSLSETRHRAGLGDYAR